MKGAAEQKGGSVGISRNSQSRGAGRSLRPLAVPVLERGAEDTAAGAGQAREFPVDPNDPPIPHGAWHCPLTMVTLLFIFLTSHYMQTIHPRVTVTPNSLETGKASWKRHHGRENSEQAFP